MFQLGSANDRKDHDLQRPLDVIFFHPSRTPRGGIVNAMLVHALALSRNGHRVEIWTGSHAVAAKAATMGVASFQNATLANGGRALVSPRVVAALLQRRLRGVDAVIHQGGRSLLPGLVAAAPGRQFVIFHNDDLRGRRHVRNWLTLSESHAAELRETARRERLPRSVAHILNGVLDGPQKAEEARQRISATPLRIGILAELRRHKGIDILFNAAHRLVAEGVDVHLHIGGAGPERRGLHPEAERLGLARRITWHGWVDALDPFFAQFDVFCLPSRREPFGLVVIEAMARGKVVVASRTRGPSEIIADGETGYLVPVNDEAALAERLRFIAAEPAEAAAVAQAGRAHVLQAYSIAAVGASLEAAIRAAT